MSPSEFLTRPGAAEALKRILKPAIAAYVLAVLWFGGRAVLLHKTASEASAAAKSDVAAVMESRKKLSAMAVDEKKPVQVNTGVIGAFQSLIQKQADLRACSISEFEASSDALPYLSAFKKDPKPGVWTQTEVVFSLKGRMPDVYQALGALSAQKVPFEFCTLEMTRDGVSANGTSTVVARVQGRVLIRGGEAKS